MQITSCPLLCSAGILLLITSSIGGCSRSHDDCPIPSIGLSATALSFACNEGGADPSFQGVSLTNNGDPGSTLSWTVSTDQPWLSVTPTSGTLTTAEAQTLTLSVHATLQLEAWLGATSTANAPSPRLDGCAVGTNSAMILWGGNQGALLDTGGIFNPLTNTWTGSTSTTGAPSPRELCRAVWTGSEMIVWGGSTGASPSPISTYYNTGYRYDPVSNTWLGQITTTGAPSGRSFHSAVWTGTYMVVWGGYDGTQRVNSGGIYDPLTDTWIGTTSTVNAPSPRLHHSAVWTGSEMIVWGGQDTVNVNDGAKYNPTTDTWTPITTTNAPTPRQAFSSVWSGREMVIWGGALTSGSATNTGGRYNPLSDTWVAATTTVGAPSARISHHGAWAANRMVVSHGSASGLYFDTGGIYVPPIPAIGSHAGSVTVTATSASNSPRSIAVTLTVNP